MFGNKNCNLSLYFRRIDHYYSKQDLRSFDAPGDAPRRDYRRQHSDFSASQCELRMSPLSTSKSEVRDVCAIFIFVSVK